jgi:SAM-dependent methyltransferase
VAADPQRDAGPLPLISVVGHFDSIAGEYDEWKRRNWYYQSQLIDLIRRHVPPGRRVVEYGCGTGDILAALDPSAGWGVDISAGMLDRARRKYADRPALSFHLAGEFRRPDPPPDFIVLADVVEHIEYPGAAFHAIASLAGPRTVFVVTMVNPIWQPIFLVLEALGLKMPEGPHRRRAFRAIRPLLEAAGWCVRARSWRCLLPAGPFARWNPFLDRIPVVRRLGVIEWFVMDPMKETDGKIRESVL